MNEKRQERFDTLYWASGPCCAGCDFWQHINSMVGECTKSAPVSGEERSAMLDMYNCSLFIGAGHIFTPREHVCGDFRDSFDWQSLPLAYRKRVGARLTSLSNGGQ